MSLFDSQPLFPPGSRLRHGVVDHELHARGADVLVRIYANPSTAAAAASRFNRAAQVSGFGHTFYSLKHPDRDTGLVLAAKKVRAPRGERQ